MSHALNLSAAICFICSLASAAHAQVVQLPSIRNFSYSGGALVPDGGSASLGGNTYASSGSVSRGWGPYSTRASGSTFGTSTSSVSVQIIDLRALDEAILAADVSKSTQAAVAPRGQLTNGRSLVGSSTSGITAPNGLSPVTDPGKWQRVLAGGHPTIPVHESLAESDIRYFLKMGQEAEAANRLSSARVYYRMAVEAMTPEMKQRYAKILEDRKEALKADAAAATNASGRQRF